EDTDHCHPRERCCSFMRRQPCGRGVRMSLLSKVAVCPEVAEAPVTTTTRGSFGCCISFTALLSRSAPIRLWDRISVSIDGRLPEVRAPVSVVHGLRGDVLPSPRRSSFRPRRAHALLDSPGRGRYRRSAKRLRLVPSRRF